MQLLSAWENLGLETISLVHKDAHSLIGKNQWERKMMVNDALTSPIYIRSRLADLNRVFDQYPDEKFILAGHSYGAYTSMIAAGMETAPGWLSMEVRTERVLGFIALSPPGPGERGIHELSWQNCTRPFLSIYGTQDYGVGGQDPSWRHACYALTPHQNKLETIVSGDHYCFLDGRNLDVLHSVTDSTYRYLELFHLSEEFLRLCPA